MSMREDAALVPLGGQFADVIIPYEESILEGISTDPYIPSTLQDLDTGEGSLSRMLSIQSATSLQIPFLPIQARGKQSIFIQEYSKYRDVPQLSGKLRY